jgi:hypothetical protein
MTDLQITALLMGGSAVIGSASTAVINYLAARGKSKTDDAAANREIAESEETSVKEARKEAIKELWVMIAELKKESNRTRDQVDVLQAKHLECMTARAALEAELAIRKVDRKHHDES